ncbi:hypothetical protein ACIBVQ_31360, partial [Streptosporangium sp. NPDC049376]
ARRAAAEYAAVIASVGLDAGEAIRIVQAALTSGTETRAELDQPVYFAAHRSFGSPEPCEP